MGPGESAPRQPAGTADPPPSQTIRLRVRYTEVDAMGYLHHSRFLQYFEMGRVELLRSRGVRYADIERQGVFFVVVRAEVKYRQPARYDDELEIMTHGRLLSPVRMEFLYEVKRVADGVTAASGWTRHAALDTAGRPCRLPARVREVFA